MTLSGATTPSQCGPGSDGNKGVLCIPQSSVITETSPSDCLVLYPKNSLGESYSSAKMQSVYSTAPADRAMQSLVLRSFLAPLRYYFLAFSSISVWLMVLASNIPKYLYYIFSLSVLMFSKIGSSIPSVGSLLPLFIVSMVPSLYPGCTFFLFVSEFPVLFHFWQIIIC